MAQDNQDLIQLEKKLLDREEKLEEENKKLQELKEKYQEKLEKVSGLTPEQAKKELFDQVELNEAKAVAKIIKEREDEAKATADKKAQEILMDSMRFGAVNYIANIQFQLSKSPTKILKAASLVKKVAISALLNKPPE